MAVPLPSGRALSAAEATTVLRDTDARVVALVGPSDAGKTSLVACVYDLFQQGPLGAIGFSRSKTLHSLEITCHDARMASRRAEPHTNRTPIGAVSFYHLELVDTRSGQRTALLLGDRAGEEYRAAADDVQSVASLVEVNRADVLTILVDGKRLIDNIARHNVRVDVSMTLQALQDGGGLTSRPRVAMVLTKLDLVKASAVQARAFRDFARIAALVQETFGANLGEVSTFQVAAAPRRSDVDRGIGVDSLIEYWMRPRLAPVARIAKALLPDRMFARLAPGNAPSGDAL